MGGGFQFIDIILFALIAAFFVFRLRGVLGRRDGHEQPGPFNRAARGGGKKPGDAGPQPDDSPSDGPSDNVVVLPGQKAETQAETGAETGAEPAWGDDPLGRGFAAIRSADKSFEPDEFLAGARVAFDMILSSFAAGDRKALKNLLSPEVFADFDRVISERERQNRTVEDTLVGITSAEIVEASLAGREAAVTVKFVSEQINAARDENGEVVDGDPEKIIKAADFWTFARNVRARDPNWSLIATASAE